MYVQRKLVPFGTLSTITINQSIQAFTEGSSEKLLNAYLQDGWEIIEIISHRSELKDCTVLAALMGKPVPIDNK